MKKIVLLVLVLVFVLSACNDGGGSGSQGAFLQVPKHGFELKDEYSDLFELSDQHKLELFAFDMVQGYNRIAESVDDYGNVDVDVVDSVVHHLDSLSSIILGIYESGDDIQVGKIVLAIDKPYIDFLRYYTEEARIDVKTNTVCLDINKMDDIKSSIEAIVSTYFGEG